MKFKIGDKVIRNIGVGTNHGMCEGDIGIIEHIYHDRTVDVLLNKNKEVSNRNCEKWISLYIPKTLKEFLKNG